MYPAPPQLQSTMSGDPPAPAGPSGTAQWSSAGYPPQMLPPPGMYPPPPQAQSPIRLARFPGDALHAQQAAPPGSLPPQQQQEGMAAPQRASSSGRQSAVYPLGPGMQPLGPMMPMPPRMMGAGGAMLPQMLPMPLGGMPPGYNQQYQLPHPPAMMMPMMQQPPSPMQGVGSPGQLRSGAVTPKSLAGSGANTPLHPLQRTLSGGQLATMVGSTQLPLPAQQLPYMQPPQGMVPLMPPPPGIVLPESLSPGSPSMLRPAGSRSARNSRVQSATMLGHARSGSGSSFGGALEPLMPPPQPMRSTSMARSKSSGSNGTLTSGVSSMRGSIDLAGNPVRRNGDRTPGGYLGSGSRGALLAGRASRAPSLGASRAGSAGRRTAGTAGSFAAAGDLPEIDEYDNIKVAVRIRPPNAQELARGDAQAVHVNPADFRQIQMTVPPNARNSQATTKNFTFHACLHPSSRQQDVLRLCGITQLLDAAMGGYNCTVLAYGQTGSGKTYTMSGREEALIDEGYMGDSDDGIITRSLMYFFENMEQRAGDAGDGCQYALRVSFAEIYNEQVYDLIHFNKKQLQIRWDTGKGFYVPDLVCKKCSTLEEALKVVSLAVRHRRVGSHEMNMESSRSHSIFTVYVDCTPTRPDDDEYGITRYGKVSFVDLAGSERLRDSKSVGETLKETTNINRSLFMLGKVIAALADGAQGARVPYRESKLTKLLMDSLGGSSLSLLIACCSPSAAHVEETLSTLSYAARAKNIRNLPAVQVDPDQAALSALKREVKLLRAENAYLREQLLQASLPRGKPAAPAAGSLAGSRLPSSHGQLGTPGGSSLLLQSSYGASGAVGEQRLGAGAPAALASSRPASGAAAGAASGGPLPLLSAASTTGPTPSPELMRRLLETQRMLLQFSRENERLAGENGRLRNGRALVSNDYKGALEEVDWLRGKLETLSAALKAGSLDGTMLAALDGTGDGGMSAPKVLEAARAALQGAHGGVPLTMQMARTQSTFRTEDAAGGAGGEPSGAQEEGASMADAGDDGRRRSSRQSSSALLRSLEPLASQTEIGAAKSESAAAAEQAVAEAEKAQRQAAEEAQLGEELACDADERAGELPATQLVDRAAPAENQDGAISAEDQDPEQQQRHDSDAKEVPEQRHSQAGGQRQSDGAEAATDESFAAAAHIAERSSRSNSSRSSSSGSSGGSNSSMSQEQQGEVKVAAASSTPASATSSNASEAVPVTGHGEACEPPGVTATVTIGGFASVKAAVDAPLETVAEMTAS